MHPLILFPTISVHMPNIFYSAYSLCAIGHSHQDRIIFILQSNKMCQTKPFCLVFIVAGCHLHAQRGSDINAEEDK